MWKTTKTLFFWQMQALLSGWTQPNGSSETDTFYFVNRLFFAWKFSYSICQLPMFHLGLFLQSRRCTLPVWTEYMLKVCGIKMHGFALGEAGVVHLTRTVSSLCLILTNTYLSSLLIILQSSYNRTYTVAGDRQTLEQFEFVSAVLQFLQLWIICN